MRAFEWGVLVALALVFGMAGIARANESMSLSPPEYLEYLNEVRAAFSEGNPWRLSEREQRLFDNADRSIRSILSDRDSVEDLSGAQTRELYNSQELINSVLRGEEDERTICRRESRIGTHFRETRCVSLSTLRGEREAARHMMRTAHQHQPYFPEPGQ